MVKRILGLLVFLALSSQMNAQDEKGYVGLSAGPSIPIIDFGSKDADSDVAGYASTGAFFDVSLAYKLGRNSFGVAALLRGQINPIDNQSFTESITGGISGVSGTVETGNWVVGGLMLGAFGSTSMSKNVSIDSKFMVGFVNATSPEISGSFSFQSLNFSINQKKSNATSFAVLIGSSLKYDLGQKLFLVASVDIWASMLEFENVAASSSIGTTEEGSFSQNMIAINPGLGVVMKL